LADVMEALLGAALLDGGIPAARAVFDRSWRDELAKPPPSQAQNNPKLALMQWAHTFKAPNPAYRVVTQTGSDHAPTFSVEVTVAGYPPLTAQGRSRQDAEKAAATGLLQREGLI
ncbi:MAG TPA: putative dsRNA-binding protein, partial [Brevundimonas sp.]|nr:putative dsRNA-binding protein [Brevundimonas sp.]